MTFSPESMIKLEAMILLEAMIPCLLLFSDLFIKGGRSFINFNKKIKNSEQKPYTEMSKMQ